MKDEPDHGRLVPPLTTHHSPLTRTNNAWQLRRMTESAFG